MIKPLHSHSGYYLRVVLYSKGSNAFSSNDFKEVFGDDNVVKINCQKKQIFSVKLFITQAPDVDLSKNPYADGKFKFNDQALLDEINLGNKVTM